MIRFTIIIVGILMILRKLYQIIKKKLEYYNDTSKKHIFNVQLAKTKKEKEIGLMYVKKLPLDSGMLFEYKDKSYPSMWMKNTLIPLDAIFINKDARVVHIEYSMTPKSLKKRDTKKPCKYVLEINGGLAKKMDIKEGDRIGTSLLSKNITDFKEPKNNKKTNTKLVNKNNKNKNNSLKTNSLNKKKKNNKNK
jgi:uncharacterized protein